MNDMPPIAKESQENTLFIIGRGSAMDGKWFHIPFIFERVGDNLFRHWNFNNLPEGVKKDIQPLLIPNQEKFNEGVDACIEELREEFMETFGYADDEHGLFDNLKRRFEQLKKPLP